MCRGDNNGDDDSIQDVIELPIDGTLDLHTFSPREVRELVPDYLEECRARGILNVRIIHGKGSGTLRRMVHAVLSRIPGVISYRLADELAGSWGATLVTLAPLEGPKPPAPGDTDGDHH